MYELQSSVNIFNQHTAKYIPKPKIFCNEFLPVSQQPSIRAVKALKMTVTKFYTHT